MGNEEKLWVSPDDLPEVRYLVPDVGDHKPDPRPFLAEAFMTEDGRAPVYIRDEEGARAEYWKLGELKLVPLKPGKILSQEGFEKLIETGGGFEVSRRNDPNDDGFQMIWTGEIGLAVRFYREQQDKGMEIRTLAEVLDEVGFVEAAVAGETINLQRKHADGSVRIMRGIIIGSSEGGGGRVPTLAEARSKKG